MQFQFAKLPDHSNQIPNCSEMKLATTQEATYNMVHNSQGSRDEQVVAHAANLTAIFYLQPEQPEAAIPPFFPLPFSNLPSA